jgi:hypothetical protein
LLEAVSGTGAPAKLTLRDHALAFLDEGMNRFCSEIAARKLTGEALRIAKAGSWEVSLVLDPPKMNQLPTESFRQILASSNPIYTGWPAWGWIRADFRRVLIAQS